MLCVFLVAFRRGFPINSLINDLIGKKVFPGIAVLAGRDLDILFEHHAGFRSLTPLSEPLTSETLFDTASLTKPLVIGLLTAILMDRNQLHLQDPVARFLPEFPNPDITIHHLVTHTSGTPDWHPMYLENRPYLETLIRMARSVRPGRRVEYSCPGFILLFHVLEKITGHDLLAVASREIFSPLGLENTFLKVPINRHSHCAATETGNAYERELVRKRFPHLLKRDFSWRTEVIQGETHDLNAHFMGGFAGNAGLFSTARDLFRLSAEFLPRTATLIRGNTLELFAKNLTPGGLSHRSLGFKLNSTPLTSAGRGISSAAFGHNGFTGVSLWIDPRSETRYILLTNRVHPRVTQLNFNRIRRRLHRALAREIRNAR